MSGDASAPRPEILALDTWIRAVLACPGSVWNPEAGGSALFLEPGLHAIPAPLIRDAVLEPVDKLTWLVIYQAGIEVGGWGEFPSYKAITAAANVGSSATVSRALAVLRLTRWLTQVSDNNPLALPRPGNVYALHGAPLMLTDTLFLDADYGAFITKARSHYHARVRNQAEQEYTRLVEHHKNEQEPQPNGGGQRQETATMRQSQLSQSGANGNAGQSATPLQILKSCSSSKLLQEVKTKKTTTTTTRTEQPEHVTAREAVTLEALVLPSRLVPAQHPAVARYLADVPAADRQAVLDELAGRLNAEQRGAKPVHDVLRYLHQLCRRAQGGGFAPNLGVAVRDARNTRVQALPSPPPAAPAETAAEPVDNELALRALAEIRETLGMSLRSPTATPRDVPDP